MTDDPSERDSDKENILIVDDVPKNIQVIANILAAENYEIVAATNSAQALKMAGELLPDLILLDIMMPGEDGLSVCSKLKENEDTRSIPVIFLTAKAETDDMLKGFESGGVDYVTKPFNAAELLARVRTHVELKKSKDQLVLQDEAKRHMLHVLCHDLRNPFTAITAMIELMESDPQSAADSFQFIRTCCQHGINVIEEIRAIRVLETKGAVLKTIPLNLRYAVRESLTMLRTRFDEKQVEPIVNIDESLMVLAENTALVNSVLNNIFSNAVKFSKPGSRIYIDASKKGAMIRISIRDTGIGIPKDILAALFDVRAATSRPGTAGEKGTGFGMPLVKKYIDLFEGTIEVHSHAREDGPGTETGTEVVLKLKNAKQ